MPMIQSVLKKTADRASPKSKVLFTSSVKKDEAIEVENFLDRERQGDRSKASRWSFSIVSNVLSRVGFVELMRDLMKETMPKARLWTWRHVGCPTGCRCPVYVSFYTIQGVSSTPDGHVRYVYRDCRRGLGTSPLPPKKDGASQQHETNHHDDFTKAMGIQLHAIEVYVSTSANGMDVASSSSTPDVVGSQANAHDAAKKNMWPLFELRFVQSTVNPLGILPDDDIVDVGSREGQDLKHLHFCDRDRLSSALELLWQFVRRRDGEDLWHRWMEMIPKTIQSVETLLLNPLIEIYRGEVSRKMSRKSSEFKGFDVFYTNEVVRGCTFIIIEVGSCVSLSFFFPPSSTHTLFLPSFLPSSSSLFRHVRRVSTCTRKCTSQKSSHGAIFLYRLRKRIRKHEIQLSRVSHGDC